MRIMHLILAKGFAGSQRAAAEMCNAQAGAHDVLLVIKRGNADEKGVSIRRWVDPRVRVAEVHDWFLRAGIARAIKQFNPDVIHAHLRRSTRMLAKIRPGAATVATLHITVNDPHFAALDGIICIARWQHADIPAGYRGRVYDIKLPYIKHRRLSPEEVKALRNELGVAPHEFLIGGVGRLTQAKGFDTLIEAFKLASLRDTKLVILGEGRERAQLEKLLAPGISLPGFRSNIKDYFQAFDAFVCPSRSEPFGYVLLEALDAGVPVIASKAHGPVELLEDYPGELFPIDDVAALAALLGDHRNNPRPRQPQRLDSFLVQNTIGAIEHAYRELIESKRSHLSLVRS
jgi:glycosyltransferase involved in cell wall biosynthesis